MTIIETKKLKKKFDGVKAVNDLSFQIEKGKITGIIGPNGSGKTTLINLLTGIIPIDSGTVIIEGTEKLVKIKPSQVSFYGITRTFQDVRIFEQMTVLDNILVVLTERHVLKALFERHKDYYLKHAEEVLRKVDLWDKKTQLAATLSYGQRKLLEIGRALAMKAEIYFFDEPFAGLFPEMVKIISNIMMELKRENKSIILIEHNINLIRQLSDYVFVMDEGEILAEGRPEEVLRKKEVVEAYLGD